MARAGSIETTTIRDFGGGLNTVHDDLNMETRYSKIETNVFNNINGTKAKRYGTKFLVDVKSYPQVTEHFNEVPCKVTHIVTIPQDTIHNVEANDTITITSPAILTGTYTVSSVVSNTIIIPITQTVTETQWNEIVFTINSDSNSETTTSGVLSGQNLLLTKFPNSPVTSRGKITITYPSDIEGTYDIVGSTENDFKIQIDGTINISTLTDIKYTFSSDLLKFNVVRYAASFTYEDENHYVFPKAEHYNLLIGHKLKIGTTEYTVIKSDKYYYEVDAGENTQDLTDVETTHDNRSIKGNYIVNCEYFLDKIIFVTDIGEVCMLNGLMDNLIIFNDTISRQLNPENQDGGWSDGVDSVCFTVFNGILTLWNGKDKPLAINFENINPCNYLYDEATGSNVNIPRAKYALAFNHYLIAGNIYDEDEGIYHTDRISISARDSIGTFYDPTGQDYSNDGVYVDLGKVISSNSQNIKGIARYRNKVAVGFEDATVFGTLGNYVESTDSEGITIKEHVPNFEDVINNLGCISNRTFANIKSDLVCLDYSGLPLFRSSNLTSQVIPARISENITPELYKNYKGLYEYVIENRIFSIINPKENQYLLFIPNSNELSGTDETICYAYTMSNGINNSVLQGAWSKFVGWNFECGCTSALNEVFLVHGTKFYHLGNVDVPYYADFIDDEDYPPQGDEDVSGKAIDFEWEFPWTDFGTRALTKHTRYIQISSTGNAKFNLDLFTDYIYYDVNDNKNPQLSLSLVGGDSYGYGDGKNVDETDTMISGLQLYGASCRTNSEMLFAYPAKFKIAKLNINGSSKYKLNINSITIYYQRGNIRR